MPSLRAATSVALLALCVASPAALAHEGNPNYRSEVRRVAPALPGLDARVLNFDDRIEVVYDGPRPLVVEGYRGEPYLRFRPDGRVEVNRRSPAAYLNDDRFAQVDVPRRADPKAAPAWLTVAENGRYSWHDHRIHWMSEGTLPSPVEGRSGPIEVFSWRIPVAAGGTTAAVRGTLTWVGEPDGGFPVAAALSLGGAALAGGLLVVWVRRRRRGPARTEREAW